MFSALRVMRVTTRPMVVSETATVELAQSAAVVWSFMVDPSSPGRLQEEDDEAEVESAVRWPGSPVGLGEVQASLERAPGKRAVGALEVLEYEPERRAVSRSLTGPYLSYGILTMQAQGSDSCRLTQEQRIYLPAGTALQAVAEAREQAKAAALALARLVQLAPQLSAGGSGEEPAPEAEVPGPAGDMSLERAEAWLRAETETARKRRTASRSDAVVAVVATGLVIALSVGNSRGFESYPRMGNGPTLILAAVVVVAAAALAGTIRLLAGKRASVAQWVHRYTAGVLLLAPGTIILAGRFSAFTIINDCGTLLDRDRFNAPIADFRLDCDFAAHSRLRDVIVWLAAAGLAALTYGLRQRRLHARTARAV